MVNYQNSKIYRISSIEGGLTYYGSTANLLCKRMEGHRSKYKAFLAGKEYAKRCTSFDVLAFEDAEIILIEAVPCNNVEELKAHERRYIEGNPCVNKCVPGKLNELGEVEYKAQYYQANSEKIKEYQGQYYQANEDKINQKHDCPCGGRFTHQHQARHLRTAKHVNYQNAQN